VSTFLQTLLFLLRECNAYMSSVITTCSKTSKKGETRALISCKKGATICDAFVTKHSESPKKCTYARGKHPASGWREGVSERCTCHLVYTFPRDWQELKREGGWQKLAA
jgi:hypothetical protein